jgi:CheY-like chemotaxis protein
MAKAGTGTIEGRMRVAVVDDDSDTRLFFRDVLQSETGFSFAGGFSNAGEALKGIPPLHPDLVLMDVNLPGMDGIECAKRLKEVMLQLNVVIVSGNRETNCFVKGSPGIMTFVRSMNRCRAKAFQKRMAKNSKNLHWRLSHLPSWHSSAKAIFHHRRGGQ